MTTSSQHFPFHFSSAYRLAARAFGVIPDRCEVILASDELIARFGPWRVQTGIDNIRAASVTGPYAFLKTAGPARLGFTDRSLTFASNGERGVELAFARAVRGIEPTGLLRHPSLTLTLADIDGFIAALADHQANPRSPD